MIKKFYGNIYIDQRDLNNEGINYPIEFEYYKIISKKIRLFKRSIKKYGVKIVRKIYMDKKIVKKYSIKPNISLDETAVDMLLEIIKMSGAGPTVLEDVIHDLSLGKNKIIF